MIDLPSWSSNNNLRSNASRYLLFSASKTPWSIAWMRAVVLAGRNIAFMFHSFLTKVVAMGRGIVKKEQSLVWEACLMCFVRLWNQSIKMSQFTHALFLGIICDRHGRLVNILKALWVRLPYKHQWTSMGACVSLVLLEQANTWHKPSVSTCQLPHSQIKKSGFSPAASYSTGLFHCSCTGYLV